MLVLLGMLAQKVVDDQLVNDPFRVGLAELFPGSESENLVHLGTFGTAPHVDTLHNSQVQVVTHEVLNCSRE
jgi:hypothetical protein